MCFLLPLYERTSLFSTRGPVLKQSQALIEASESGIIALLWSKEVSVIQGSRAPEDSRKGYG